MEIIRVYDVDLSLCDFLGKPDVIQQVLQIVILAYCFISQDDHTTFLTNRKIATNSRDKNIFISL